MMKVLSIILAGGKGRRLLPLTLFFQKTIFPVAKKKRMIDFAIESTLIPKHEKIKGETVVLAGYKANQIRRYVKSRNLKIRVLEDEIPLGTGGSLLHHWDIIEKKEADAVLILPGDHYVQLPLVQLTRIFQKNPNRIFLVGIKSDEFHHDYIEVANNRKAQLHKFSQRKSNIAYTGISLIPFPVLREQIESLRKSYHCDLTSDIVMKIAEKFETEIFLLDGQWCDLGTWKGYLKFLWT